MTINARVDRRQFLRVSSMVGGGLLLGTMLDATGAAQLFAAEATPGSAGEFTPNAWIRLSPDGHFWARATIDGIERRMLIDSGATITALSARTARRAGIEAGQSLVPVLMRTANGTVRAETGRIRLLRLGDIEARDLPVVIAPALGDVDILGMNFLTQLESWRVEGRTLILVPGGEKDGAGRREK